MSKILWSNYNNTHIPFASEGRSSTNYVFRAQYGVYETILYHKEHLVMFEQHYDRMMAAFEHLAWRKPDNWTLNFFKESLLQLIQLNQLQTATLRCRIQCFITEHKNGINYLIELFDVDEQEISWNEKGLQLGVLTNYHKPNTLLSNFKLSHLDFFIPAQKLKTNKYWDDVLIHNESGHVIETSIANLFWFANGIFYTTPLNEACLAGTMRAYIIDKMKHLNIPIVETICTKAHLEAAKECFTCNSIRPLRWVAQIHFDEAIFYYENTNTKKLYNTLGLVQALFDI